MRLSYLFILLALAAPVLAEAADDAVGNFGNWRAFRFIEKGNHVCYMIAHPAGWKPPAPAKTTPKKSAPAKASPAKKKTEWENDYQNPLLILAATGEKKTTAKTPAKKTPAKAAPKKEAAPKKREAYLTITFRPSESMAPVFNYNADTALKEEVEATIVIGKESFKLFAVENGAWARSSALDQAIVRALRKGGRAEVTATTSSGIVIKDTFDLKGAEPSFDKISSACGIS